MKSYLLSLAAIAAPALAQLGNLPQCALNCALGALPSQCAVTNVTCICEQSSYIQQLEPCVESSCSPANQTTALSAALALCASAGVTLSVSVPQTSAPITSAPASSSAPAVTTTSTSTSLAVSNVSNTTSSPPSVFTGAAPTYNYVSGALVAGFGALIAIL